MHEQHLNKQVANRSKVELESVVVDAQGVIVAELYATYIVQRQPGSI